MLAIMIRFAGRAMRCLLAFAVLLGLVAGLPWALVYFIGWPLPNHLPTWDEIQATLLNPMSTQFLLDTLAVVCWIAWLLFVLEVLHCAVDTARTSTWPHVRAPGPLHGLAVALTGAIVLTLLGNRTPSTTPAMTTFTGDVAPVAATAPLTSGPAAHTVVMKQPTLVIDRAALAPPGMVQVIEEVQLPQDGIYDSLWRIAERIYGPDSGNRWPELFELNRGVEQSDGHTLTNPNLIRPGWKITAYIPAPPEDHPAEEQPPPTNTPPSTQPTPDTTQAPTETGKQSNDQTEPGLDLMTGAFISVGLAGAITAAVVSARIWRRRRYRIGSGDRTDLRHPTAPVVRALQAAHNHGIGNDRHPANESVHAPATVGVRDSHELALNLASTRGLGLVGPGATAAVRALLIHLLAERRPGDSIRVVAPVDDLNLILDGGDVENLPSTIITTESLDAALDEMEAGLLTRTRYALEKTEPQPTPGSLVLLASPAPHAERRLQAVLDNGSALDLAGILLGQWRPGATAYVRHDGTVSATNPAIGDALAGARLFTLPATDTTELLTVLHDAEGPPAQSPRTPDSQVSRESPSASAAPEVRDEDCADIESSGVAAPQTEVPLEQQTPASPPLAMRILGLVQLSVHDHDREQEFNCELTSKQCEVLVFLALHPQGVRRETLNEAVWPESKPPRPYNSFHSTLSLLRRALRKATDGTITNLVLNDNGRYHLNTDLVAVDFWQLQHALRAPQQTRGDAALAQLSDAVDLYPADLAEDLTSLWIEPFRESIRRDVLDALGVLSRAHHDRAPETTLALLERARKLDRYNEGVYRDIIRTQARLGQHDAIPRTLTLLTSTLAEIEQYPNGDTVNLAESLQRRENARGPA